MISDADKKEIGRQYAITRGLNRSTGRILDDHLKILKRTGNKADVVDTQRNITKARQRLIESELYMKAKELEYGMVPDKA